MNRRMFFGILGAPLVAKIRPKKVVWSPKPVLSILARGLRFGPMVSEISVPVFPMRMGRTIEFYRHEIKA